MVLALLGLNWGFKCCKDLFTKLFRFWKNLLSRMLLIWTFCRNLFLRIGGGKRKNNYYLKKYYFAFITVLVGCFELN